jgi:uncharacterized protein involved in exopolysaccharide biosynthesis
MSNEHSRPNAAPTELALLAETPIAAHARTWRDMATPIFRQRRLASLIFLGVFCGAILTGLFVPRKYQAEMKILVNRDRADTVVTPDPSVAAAPIPSVSEEDLNSEVELLTSRDLLEKVVLACGLEQRRGSMWTRAGEEVSDAMSGARNTPETRLAQSVREMRDRLIVEPIDKTTMIRVAYSSRDPQLAARVLQTLASLYQEKHAAVHRPAGAFTFFDQQTDRYRNDLATAEAQLIAFDNRQGVVAPETQQQLVLEQLSKFEAELQQEQSSAEAASARAQTLRAEESAAPGRQTTEMRQTGNAQLLAELQSTLLSLELKHTDLLVKYEPSYPPVQDVEKQITETRKAIEVARLSPVSEVTTDRVPAQDWMATELAKAEADRAEFAAEATSTERAVRHYRAVAQDLQEVDATQTDMARAVKTAEDNYLLYLRKREEARISDELDKRRIVNVSIAEAATVPALATVHFGWLLVGSLFAAGFAGVGSAYAADRMDPSFRTPEELHRYLEIRVLAAIPNSSAKE